MDVPELLVGDASEWHGWLSDNHSESEGVWLVLAKKGTIHPTSLSYDDASTKRFASAGSMGNSGDAQRNVPETIHTSQCPQPLVAEECD